MASSGNFCTWDVNTDDRRGIAKLSHGNCRQQGVSTADAFAHKSTFGFNSGKWYFEFSVDVHSSSYPELGLTDGHTGKKFRDNNNGVESEGFHWNVGDSTLDDRSSNNTEDLWGTITLTNTGVTACSDGDVAMLALDVDGKKIWFGKNGTWFNSGNPATGANQQGSWTGDMEQIHIRAMGSGSGSVVHMNAGADSSCAGRETAGDKSDDNERGEFIYQPPTGYLAACGANLNTITGTAGQGINPSGDDGEDKHPGKNMGVVTYTGNAGTKAVTGLGFQPDAVFIKIRNTASNGPVIDSTRGTNNKIFTQITDAATTGSNLQSFDADGFTLGSESTHLANFNGSTNTYMAVCFKANGGTTSTSTAGTIASTVQANDDAGFSIVKWEGQNDSWGNAITLGHGLSAAPDMIWAKNYDKDDEWPVFHAHVGAGGGTTAAHNSLVLNTNAALYTNQSYKSWGGVMPTSTVFTVDGNNLNGSGESIVAYCWRNVEGYCKFGKYQGSARDLGPTINTGFFPRVVVIKEIDNADDWVWWVRDNDGSVINTINPRSTVNRIDADSAEFTGTGRAVDFVSNGFRWRSSNNTMNADATFVYGAWGEIPFAFSGAGV